MLRQWIELVSRVGYGFSSVKLTFMYPAYRVIKKLLDNLREGDPIVKNKKNSKKQMEHFIQANTLA